MDRGTWQVQFIESQKVGYKLNDLALTIARMYGKSMFSIIRNG